MTYVSGNLPKNHVWDATVIEYLQKWSRIDERRFVFVIDMNNFNVWIAEYPASVFGEIFSARINPRIFVYNCRKMAVFGMHSMNVAYVCKETENP